MDTEMEGWGREREGQRSSLSWRCKDFDFLDHGDVAIHGLAAIPGNQAWRRHAACYAPKFSERPVNP